MNTEARQPENGACENANPDAREGPGGGAGEGAHSSTHKGTRGGNRSARMARFFLDLGLIPNEAQVLDKRASHHISTVLRMRKGDKLVLFNGDGHDYPTEIVEAGRRTEVFIRERRANPSESSLELTLVQCISRGERMDSTIRQSVELGVTRICPVSSRHSVKLDDPMREAKKLAHWQNIVISAAEQSGRSFIPRLDAPCSLDRWLEQEPDGETLRLTLAPDAAQGLADVPEADCAFVVLVGPESGLDNDEMERAAKHGFQTIRMGPRVLRTETAGPSILSILQARNGDMT